METIAFQTIYICLLLAVGYSLLRRIVLWIGRIGTFKKTMPVVIALFPTNSFFRLFWPKKWQTFHQDWHMQYNRTIYRKLGSDIFAMVCVFGYDNVFICDPLATIDIAVTQSDRFPRDTQVAEKVFPCLGTMLRVDWCLWSKRNYNVRRKMEVLSESYFTYVFPEESATCSR